MGLGTLMFAVLTFLFPTVLAFYAFFALVRILVFSTQAVLRSCIDFFHHFPMFYLLVCIVNPLLLPGGISFRRVTHSTGNGVSQGTVLELRSVGIGISAVIAPYASLVVHRCKQLAARLLLKQFPGPHLYPAARWRLRSS